MSFTTGGDANWAPTTAEYYYGGDSAQSGEVSASETSWLETTVIGEGTIKFWRMLSGEGDLTFSIDGYWKGSWYGPTGWAQSSTYNIEGLGPHTIRWSYSGVGSAFVDYVQWTSTSEPVQSLQEALDVGWPIVTGGDADWYKVSSPAYYDGDSAKSGYIYDDEVSQMQAIVEGEGTGSFWWKVSSEQGNDELKFYIDGVLKGAISGDEDWDEKEFTLTGSGSHSLLWEYDKDSGTTEDYDCGWVDWLQGPGTAPPVPDPFAEALDCDLSFTTGGNSDWEANTLSGYYGGDSARSGSPDDYMDSWLQTTVEGEGTITFWWKVYSEEGDYLEFYIDDVLKAQIDEWVYWEQKSYNISGSGTHTLKWRYKQDDDVHDGDDSGSVDYVQWSGSSPPDPTNWDTITYTYDPAGRRIKKNVVGSDIVKYVYDGGHVIAEYDDSNLLRKYIYGARLRCGSLKRVPKKRDELGDG